jgi:hypothetical protein
MIQHTGLNRNPLEHIMPWIAPMLSSGLGNRLFQYAAAAGLAELWNMPLHFIIHACNEIHHGSISTVFRMFPRIPLSDSSENALVIKEPPYAYYDYIPYGDTPPPNVFIVVDGFRQSPLYFPKELQLLIPDWDSALGGPLVRKLIEKKAFLQNLEERKRTISIHIRLGDYVGLAKHQVDLGKYYFEALQRVKPGQRLHLFSDEPMKCAALFHKYCTSKGILFSVATLHSDVESLYEMSLCLGGNIVANSTFSWWGAWYAHHNGSPWATYPSNWGKGQPQPTDLFPEWATVISV